MNSNNIIVRYCYMKSKCPSLPVPVPFTLRWIIINKIYAFCNYHSKESIRIPCLKINMKIGIMFIHLVKYLIQKLKPVLMM